MSSINVVVLCGNLTADPELSYTPGGKPVCKCSLAVNNQYKNTAGEIVQKPLFIDLIIWNKQAENVAKYKRKGDQVTIDGMLELDQWERDNIKHRKHKVVCRHVTFGLNARRDSSTEAPENDTAQEEAPEQSKDIPL